jgi:hypothetical protein
MVTRNKDRPVQVIATPTVLATDNTLASPAIKGESTATYALRL